MSGKKSGRGRRPAHQNTFAFKHNKNSKKTKKILGIPNVAVCERCEEIIEWRKKFRKYKPLKAPKSCQKCRNKTVTLAYHMICKKCAEKHNLCAKCLKPHDVSIGTNEDESIEAQIEKLETGKVFGIRERERRAMLRSLYAELENQEGGSDEEGEQQGQDVGGEERKEENNEEEGEECGDNEDGYEGSGLAARMGKIALIGDEEEPEMDGFEENTEEGGDDGEK